MAICVSAHFCLLSQIYQLLSCYLSLSVRFISMDCPHESFSRQIKLYDATGNYPRLCTYIGFQSPYMTATCCANAGFIYDNKGPDSVACPWCGTRLSGFKETINPVALHMATSMDRHCEFIKVYCSQNMPGVHRSLYSPSTGD